MFLEKEKLPKRSIGRSDARIHSGGDDRRALARACLGYPVDFFEKNDFHIHVPEGATPKDGPSAGIGMCTTLMSVISKIPVRSTVAMTGEITLRGEVLPIGGLKEKLLAAMRGGIEEVLIPHENERDLREIPKEILDALTIHPVRWIDQVFAVALQRMPEALPPPATPSTDTTILPSKEEGSRGGEGASKH